MGFAFKPQTDDVREAAALTLCRELVDAGATVRAYDPEARETARKVLGDAIEYVSTSRAAAAGADALVLVTEWSEFRNPDFVSLKETLRRPLLVDGRNIYDPAEVRSFGFEYHGIGRL